MHNYLRVPNDTDLVVDSLLYTDLKSNNMNDCIYQIWYISI